MEQLRRLFAEKYVVDDREPVGTFVWLDEEEWGVYAPKWQVWQQMFVILLLQVAFQCCAAVFNYYFIVKQRQREQNTSNTSKQQARRYSPLPTSAYLLGWGVMIPLAVYSPYWLLRALDIQSRVSKMSTGTSAFIVGFRTVEAMYETSPHSVEASLANYVTYYSSLMHFDWDPKTATRRKIPAAELLRETGMLIFLFHVLSAVLSLEIYHGFRPFPSAVDSLSDFHFNTDLLSPGHLVNAYILAVLVYLTLSFGFRLTALGEQCKGYRTQPIFHNPLFASRSPSEFWGRKWNLTIHRLLKHGAFLPARHFCSTGAAVLVTFVVSGLIHDYAWTLMFHQDDHNDFAPIFWKLTAFFAWNGVIMWLERSAVGSWCGKLTRRWPTLLVSTLVVLTALPVSHWYSGDWVEGGYFYDLSIGTWLIRPLKT